MSSAATWSADGRDLRIRRLAKQFIARPAPNRHPPGQLTLHATRPSMSPSPSPCCSPTWASPRPQPAYTSDDNPSANHTSDPEIRPIPDASAPSRTPVSLSGLFRGTTTTTATRDRLHDPADVHYGRTPAIIEARSQTLNAAFEANLCALRQTATQAAPSASGSTRRHRLHRPQESPSNTKSTPRCLIFIDTFRLLWIVMVWSKTVG